MLEKYKYECLILWHKAKWFYVEFYEAIVAIAFSAVVLLILVAVNLYIK